MGNARGNRNRNLAVTSGPVRSAANDLTVGALDGSCDDAGPWGDIR
jgi:hypothetical protein